MSEGYSVHIIRRQREEEEENKKIAFTKSLAGDERKPSPLIWAPLNRRRSLAALQDYGSSQGTCSQVALSLAGRCRSPGRRGLFVIVECWCTQVMFRGLNGAIYVYGVRAEDVERSASAQSVAASRRPASGLVQPPDEEIPDPL